MTTLQEKYPYYEFMLDKYEGRYWNVNGYGCAVVALYGC